MNFTDEVYVRLYTRDSATWLRLGFEGQTVLMHTLRKLDRSGILDGIEDVCADVALLTGVPLAIVETGMPRLLQRGVFQHCGSKLIMPNFLEAQNCRQSDRLRQEESRAKRRSAALGTVTNRDQQSQNVTECHQPSPTVTVGHSLHCSAVHSSAVLEREAATPSAAPPAADAAPSLAGPALRPPEQALEEKQTAQPDAHAGAKRNRRGPLWHRVPIPWSPDEKTEEVTRALLGVGYDAELQKFRDWEFKDAKSDANAAWRTWARRANEGKAKPNDHFKHRSNGPRQPNHGKTGWEETA